MSQANSRAARNALKEVLVRTPDPAVEAAEIIPLDRIQIPDTDDLPPLRQLVATAMAKRPGRGGLEVSRPDRGDGAAGHGRIRCCRVLQVTVQTYQSRRGRNSAGEQRRRPNPYFVGGYGTALGQIFRRNFPNYIGERDLSRRRLDNRTAQGDYGIDQLQFRQSQLSGAARHQSDRGGHFGAHERAAAGARAVLGGAWIRGRCRSNCWRRTGRNSPRASRRSTTSSTTSARWWSAQISEVNALAAYAHARVSLDQTLGETLERNNVTLDEGLNGRVERQSELQPGTTPVEAGR